MNRKGLRAPILVRLTTVEPNTRPPSCTTLAGQHLKINVANGRITIHFPSSNILNIFLDCGTADDTLDVETEQEPEAVRAFKNG